MHKKIKFQTLQRFDLTDAEELQSGVDAKLSTTLKALDPWIGNFRQGAPLTKVSVISSDSSKIITFGPMKLINGEYDDIIEINQDDIDEGLASIDISSFFSSYNSARNNGTIMPGMYFYAYPLIEDSDTESRQFYNIIEESITSRSVATRSRTRIRILALANSSFSALDANGKYPILLGYVKDANVLSSAGGSAFLPSNFISNTFTQSFYGESMDFDDTGLTNAGERVDFTGIDNLSNANTYQNFKLVFERLRRQLNRIVSYGEFDLDETQTLPIDSKPEYSLQGLKALINDLDDNTDATIQNVQTEALEELRIYYALETEDTGSAVTWSTIELYTSPVRSDVEIFRNFRFYAQNGGTPGTTITSGDMSATEESAILRNLVISLPETYSNKYIAGIHINQIIVDTSNSYNFDTTHNQARYQACVTRVIDGLVFSDDNVVGKNKINYPSEITYYDVAHNEQTVDYGIELLIEPLEVIYRSSPYRVHFEIVINFKSYV